MVYARGTHDKPFTRAEEKKSDVKEHILKEKETLEDWSHQSLKGNSFSMGKR